MAETFSLEDAIGAKPSSGSFSLEEAIGAKPVEKPKAAAALPKYTEESPAFSPDVIYTRGATPQLIEATSKGAIPGIIGGVGDIANQFMRGAALAGLGPGLEAGTVSPDMVTSAAQLRSGLPTTEDVKTSGFGRALGLQNVAPGLEFARGTGQFFGEMASPLAYSKLVKAPLAIPRAAKAVATAVTAPLGAEKEFTAALNALRETTNARIAAASTDAERAAIRIEEDRLRAGIAIRAQRAKWESIPSEQRALETTSRADAKLPEVDTPEAFAAKQDVNSQLRTLADTKLAQAQKTQEEVGGAAFQRYRDFAAEKQKTEPFGLSAPGQKLQQQLDEIASGGAGTLQKYGKQEQALAKSIKDELFPGEDPGRPVDFNLVDNKLRELRQIEQSKTPEAATAIARERFRSSADLVEDALKQWVGEAVYPREAYAQASKELNNFRSKLGEILTGREEIPYRREPGAYTARSSSLAEHVFGSRDNIGFAKELLGENEVNQLGTRLASNELHGLDATKVNDWLKNPKNAYVYEIEGLAPQLQKYGADLAAREGKADLAGKMMKSYAKDLTSTKTTAEARLKPVTQLRDALDNLRIKVQDASPSKLQEEWVKEGGLRNKLERTGKFTPEQMQELSRAMIRVSTAATRVERIRFWKDFLIKVGKWGGLPTGSVALYETFRSR
jgi:hypothetical protein